MQSFFNTTVGKKIIMAVTGQAMIFFVIIHVIGNSTIFVDGLNGYAERLHSLPVLVWLTRLIMLAVIFTHVFFSIQLTLENWKSKPEKYAVQKHLRSTLASRNMIWSGLIIALFLIYHLMHFTFQIISPDLAAVNNLDALGRPDVTHMVISGFQNFFIALIYISALVALVLHLIHGIQSSIQTIGLNNDRTLPLIIKTGVVAAIVLFIGYVSIPASILLNIVKG
jgi:succinate dehydrogenase / fumarate reductase cytochrome b subunit